LEPFKDKKLFQAQFLAFINETFVAKKLSFASIKNEFLQKASYLNQ